MELGNSYICVCVCKFFFYLIYDLKSLNSLSIYLIYVMDIDKYEFSIVFVEFS